MLMKILVAEDDPAIAEGYRLLLEASSHEVVMTADGEECLKVFRQHVDHASSASNGKKINTNTNTNTKSPFDLVILDYRMPKKNGLEVALEIRSITALQRILLATAYAYDQAITELSQNRLTQSVEILQKPFEFEHFLNIIQNKSGNHDQINPEPKSITSKSLNDNNVGLSSHELAFGNSQPYPAIDIQRNDENPTVQDADLPNNYKMYPL